MTSKMAKVKKHGKMAQSTKANIVKVSNMEVDDTFGLMEVCMRESG